MQVAVSRKTALCSTPSAPKMKWVKALCVTTCWPAWPVWVRSTVTYGADAVQVMTENPYRLARDIGSTPRQTRSNAVLATAP